MAKLDDPELQEALVRAASGSSSAADNAREIGMSRQSVHAYLRTHPELRGRVDVAHRQTRIIDHHAPRMLPEVATPPPGEATGAGSITPAGRAAFVQLLEDHAGNHESKGCSKALDILAQLHFAPEILALQAKAKREAAELEAKGAGSSRPVVIRHGAAQPRVVDAELIERPPRLDS